MNYKEPDYAEMFDISEGELVILNTNGVIISTGYVDQIRVYEKNTLPYVIGIDFHKNEIGGYSADKTAAIKATKEWLKERLIKLNHKGI